MASIPQEQYVEIQYAGQEVDPLASKLSVLERRFDAHIGKGGNVHASVSETEAGFMTPQDKAKLDGVQIGATQNSTDDFLLNRGNHTGVQPIESVSGLRQELDDALAGGSNYRGLFPSLSALQEAVPVAVAGNYADVDEGEGISAVRYIWDESDQEWVSAGEGEPLTAPQVKALYESNPNTNPLTNLRAQSIDDLSGANPQVEYSAGATLERVTQTLVRDNVQYRIKDPAELPYTLTGNWTNESDKFAAMGDSGLRQELAQAEGARMIGWQRAQLTRKIDTVSAALSGRSVNVWEFAHLAAGYTIDGDSSTWDWAPAFQAASDSLKVGDTLFVPAHENTYNIVNAATDGTGSIVSRRAAAVAAGALHAVTCSTKSVRVVIDGVVKGLSALDDIFRFSGDNVQFTGSGSVVGSGEFLDTNPSGVENPDLVQWYPSLVNLTGINSGAHGGLLFVNQPTVALRLLGNGGYAMSCDFTGGPVTHGSGTVQFYVYAGAPTGGTLGHRVMDCNGFSTGAGGKAYSGVFSVSAESWICQNRFKNCHEHGVYNYGSRSQIVQNVIDGCDLAAGIQSFAQDCLIALNNVSNTKGGIALENPDRCQVVYNTCNVGIQLSSISVRTFTGTSSAAFMDGLIIEHNTVSLSSNKQSVIDLILEHSARNCSIRFNNAKGGPIPGDSGRSAGILARILPSAANPGDGLDISFNTIEDCDGFAVVIDRFQNFTVDFNKVVNANGTGSTNVPFYFYSCSKGKFRKNTIQDKRSTPITANLLSAVTSDLNSQIQAEGNDGIGLAASTSRLCNVPDDSIGRDNTIDGYPCWGFVQVANLAGSTIPAPGVRNSMSRVILEPLDKTAVDLQAGSSRMYVSGCSAGSFNIATSNSAVPGATPTYRWQAYQ